MTSGWCSSPRRFGERRPGGIVLSGSRVRLQPGRRPPAYRQRSHHSFANAAKRESRPSAVLLGTTRESTARRSRRSCFRLFSAPSGSPRRAICTLPQTCFGTIWALSSPAALLPLCRRPSSLGVAAAFRAGWAEGEAAQRRLRAGDMPPASWKEQSALSDHAQGFVPGDVSSIASGVGEARVRRGRSVQGAHSSEPRSRPILRARDRQPSQRTMSPWAGDRGFIGPEKDVGNLLVEQENEIKPAPAQIEAAWTTCPPDQSTCREPSIAPDDVA